MKISRPSRYGVACVAIGLLASCGGSQPPFGAAGALPQSRAIAQANRSGSWMLPEAAFQDLLYIATGDNVDVVAYRNGKRVGALGVSANEVCSDAAGDVFVPHVNGSQQIFEYPHGGYVPIQILNDRDVPLGCAVDPITGNLAVTNEASGAGDVAIYPNAHEPPQYYNDPEIATFGLCGYDDSGNLLVDGTGSGNVLAELAKGSSTFANYVLNASFDPYDSVQWDGQYVTLSNPTTRTIYRLELTPRLRVIGKTHVRGWYSRFYGHWPYTQTSLQGGTFLAQSSMQATIGLWRYPQGGVPSKILGPFKSGNVQIWAVALSRAQDFQVNAK